MRCENSSQAMKMNKVNINKNGATRIVIAEGQEIFRNGLRRLLEAEPDFRVIGEAADGTQVAKVARELRPDVMLLDLALPRRSGLEALRELERESQQVHVILLAVAINKAEVIEALQLGARGVVLKESTTQQLLKSIRFVMAGQYWLGRETFSDVVGALRTLRRRPNGHGRDKSFSLTARELEVVSTIVAGYANKDVAKRFSLSEQTVKHHLTNIFNKLEVSNRLELALFAVNNQLIEDAVASV
jgi:two-component system nitrate/nitrite response regulator NarL